LEQKTVSGSGSSWATPKILHFAESLCRSKQSDMCMYACKQLRHLTSMLVGKSAHAVWFSDYF